MTVSKKDLQLLFFVIGILSVVAVVFLVFNPKKEQVEAIKSENQALEARISELNELALQKEFYLSETARIGQEVKELYLSFPADVTPEDAVSEGILMERTSQIGMQSIEYREAEQVYTPVAYSIEDMPDVMTDDLQVASEETTKTADDAAAVEADPGVSELGLSVMRHPVNYLFTGDLYQFMKAAQFVTSQDNRDVISEVTLAYDSTSGQLNGSMLLRKYYILGTDKEYEPATFNTSTGTNNLFSTYVVSETVSQEVASESGEDTEE